MLLLASPLGNLEGIYEKLWFSIGHPLAFASFLDVLTLPAPVVPIPAPRAPRLTGYGFIRAASALALCYPLLPKFFLALSCGLFPFGFLVPYLFIFLPGLDPFFDSPRGDSVLPCLCLLGLWLPDLLGLFPGTGLG